MVLALPGLPLLLCEEQFVTTAAILTVQPLFHDT
jgi:hypothetical protein